MTNTVTSVPENTCSIYDGLGCLYDRYWRSTCAQLLPPIERLVLSSLTRGSNVLDLCCGTGQLAGSMCRRGLVVTGLDGSEHMLESARRNAPAAKFVVGDARCFRFPTDFDAVVSTGDCMNHMLSAGELSGVFRCVSTVLAPGGAFVFDLNMAKAYETQWHKSSTVVGADHLMFVRGRYNRSTKFALTEITVFRKIESWMRRDYRIFQRCYRFREVLNLLKGAGFADVRTRSAASLGMRGRLAVGRTFFVARTHE